MICAPNRSSPNRFRELVEAELAAPPAKTSPARPRESTPLDWTANRVKYDKTEVPPKQVLDVHQVERARAHILCRLMDHPRPSYATLAEELSFSGKSVVGHHVQRLIEDGMLQKRGKAAPVPTRYGRVAARLILGYAGQELLWRRAIRSEWGRYSRAASLAVKSAARALDARYSLEREGARRRNGQLERKASCAEIVRALRSCTTVDAAAKKCGLDRHTFRNRVATLVRHARKLAVVP